MEYAEAKRKFLEESKLAVSPHTESAVAFEGKAIDFANAALRALTYLNGGALFATPTAVALFHTDLTKANYQLVIAAAFFVGGLVCVVLAQGAAFFTMARRAEREAFYANEESSILIALNFQQSPEEKETSLAAARDCRKNAKDSDTNSNWWRNIGLRSVWISLGFFVIGCGFGACAILSS